MTLDDVLAELAIDVRAVLGDRKVRTHDDKTAAIVALLSDLLDPGSIAAVSIPSARIAVSSVEFENARAQVDANGDLVRVELHEPAEIEWYERQE